MRGVSEICKTLGLSQSYLVLRKSADIAKNKIQHQLTKELSNQLQQNPSPRINQTTLKQRVEQLETQAKFDFSLIEDMYVNSPEDKQERLHNKAITHMNQCKNLDEFFDILFLVEETLIKANSLVLSARCPYFKSMLSRKYMFQESRLEGFVKV